MPAMKSVLSSHIQKIGYEDGSLHVEWDGGKTSVYTGVPPKTADSVMNSWSVGKALTEQVKGKYPHTYTGS